MANEVREQRIEKLNSLRESNINPYPYKFVRTHNSTEFKKEFEFLNNGEVAEDKKVKIAGRIVAKRVQGGSSFFVILDQDGKLQAYINKKIGDKYNLFKKSFDIGDWVGLSGFPFRSRTGELTIYVEDIELLSKSLLPLPEKWHGLQDKEKRYRQRYVDLIVNDDVRKAFILRTKVIKYVREFLDNKGYMEVETPMLESIPGGTNAKPFVTHINAYDMDLYMRISPELKLKRLIVGGLEKVYEINRNFRNEGVSYKHNPEFTMIELYEAYADYNDMMELTENMLSSIIEKIHGTTKIEYQGKEIDFSVPFKRRKYVDVIKENTGVDILESSNDDLKAFLKSKKVDVSELNTRAQLIEELFDLAEESIIQPTFLLDYPVEISPLTKRHRNTDKLTERFELIIDGVELANAYSELNDPLDQRERFMDQMKMNEEGYDEAQIIDYDFLRALEYGMPPAGGLGIGIDRFVMFVTNAATIRDVILFPFMKPELKDYIDKEEE
jgi:lysyl-tRNA synthetase class 2